MPKRLNNLAQAVLNLREGRHSATFEMSVCLRSATAAATKAAVGRAVQMPALQKHPGPARGPRHAARGATHVWRPREGMQHP